jgi:protocatechuate 3,4-dioxygenase beta subunit
MSVNTRSIAVAKHGAYMPFTSVALLIAEKIQMNRPLTRRAAIISSGAALMTAPIAHAALIATPRQTEGPFYPPELPLDHDNDLVLVTGAPAHALGQITHIFGKVLDLAGQPMDGAKVEIWQCDANGRYLHPRSGGSKPRDGGFQGYGQTISAADGAYRFRTIKPVPYPGRTPHIHFAISGSDFAPLVTQMYVAGEPLNESDGLLNRIDPAGRASVIVALEPGDSLEVGALQGRFDIVIDSNS